MKTAYKILKNGSSCHGGIFTWSLPVLKKDGTYTPGSWTPKRRAEVCTEGWHLTRVPGDWWSLDDGYEVYVAEYRGETNTLVGLSKSKFAVQQCRLLRPLTNKELAKHGIFREGVHDIQRGGSGRKVFFASGTARLTVREGSVTVGGEATVSIFDTVSCQAYGKSRVHAWDNSVVFAEGNVKVEAWNEATISASESAKVIASDNVQVSLGGFASAKAHGSSFVACVSSSKVVAHDDVTVVAQFGSPQIHVKDNALCRILNGAGTYTRENKALILDQRNGKVKLTRSGSGLDGFSYNGRKWTK
mgnify:CR=1 FL=1